MTDKPQSSPLKQGAGHPAPIINAPANALITVSIIGIGAISLSIVFNVFLLLTGIVDHMREPELGISKQTQVAIRLTWGLLILATNILILVSAIRMKRLENYSLAMFGSILAVVPCLGPCCIFGIPFGIWSIFALNQPGVKDSFR